jgi:hypothetical protein
MTELKSLTHNVHEHCGTRVVRVQGDIDLDVASYFFNHVIPFKHGARKGFINFFFQRLYEACKEQGIPPVWDENSERRLLELLNRLNFDKTVVVEVEKPRRKSKTKKSTVPQEFIS